MQNIINEFNTVLTGENLFSCWQHELNLRQQLRAATDWYRVRIENNQELDFLKRSLYWGSGRQIFFSIIYQNISSLPVLDYMRQAPAELTQEFLQFIAQDILPQKPTLRELDFLISMYKENLRPAYIELVQAMDGELCHYFMARTGNDDLRQILKLRQDQITLEHSNEHYGLLAPTPRAHEYPTIFGDKIRILSMAIETLRDDKKTTLRSLSDATGEPSSCHRHTADGADLLFKAGLLSDCLITLSSFLNQSTENSIPLTEHDYQKTNQVLGKALPMYSILVNPADPRRCALELFRNYYPGFSPDPVTLLYLDICSIVMASLQGHRQYARYELAQKAAKILPRRPNDILATALLARNKDSNINDLTIWEQLIATKMPGQPHEAFITLEALRWGQQEGWVILNRSSATKLLDNYLELFRWLPVAAFMNEGIYKQLGQLADEDTAKSAQQVLDLFREFSFQDSEPVSDNMKPGQEAIYRQLRLSKYMGVL